MAWTLAITAGRNSKIFHIEATLYELFGGRFYSAMEDGTVRVFCSFAVDVQ
jgi:hypothetical protein